MSDRLHLHQEEEEDEAVQSIQPASVFDTRLLGEPVPEGFDAVRILVDGQITGELTWDRQRAAAERYVSQGLKIFWEIDLGLFDRMKYPLGSGTQFMSLGLSLEHFRDTLWNEFRDHTVGLCLYRGSLDFALFFPWDDEQAKNLTEWLKDRYGTISLFNEEARTRDASFDSVTHDALQGTWELQLLRQLYCRDVLAEYLDLLAARLPDTLECFLLFDTEGLDLFTAAIMLENERFSRFLLGVKGGSLSAFEMGWEAEGRERGRIGRVPKGSARAEKAPTAVCLPSSRACQLDVYRELRKAIEILQKRGTALRTIDEGRLTVDWDGLDTLIVDGRYVDKNLLRKLHGFCAAGGTVVSLGASCGTPGEVSFAAFIGLQ